MIWQQHCECQLSLIALIKTYNVSHVCKKVCLQLINDLVATQENKYDDNMDASRTHEQKITATQTDAHIVEITNQN